MELHPVYGRIHETGTKRERRVSSDGETAVGTLTVAIQTRSTASGQLANDQRATQVGLEACSCRRAMFAKRSDERGASESWPVLASPTPRLGCGHRATSRLRSADPLEHAQSVRSCWSSSARCSVLQATRRRTGSKSCSARRHAVQRCAMPLRTSRAHACTSQRACYCDELRFRRRSCN